MYRTATISTDMLPWRLITGIGRWISFTTLKALEYPVYEKTMLTRAAARSFPLSVVPSKALR